VRENIRVGRESGCGKSTLGNAILDKATSEAGYNETSSKEMKKFRYFSRSYLQSKSI
jgi:ABC-type oligopeptide transport system ATPase subunit